MSDSPAPISYIKDEDEALNNPSISEEKQNFNNDNDYPQNIETTNDNDDTHPKPNSSIPITYKSVFPCCLLLLVIICLINGTGLTFFSLKEIIL